MTGELTVLGAGLAGCEAAWQAVRAGAGAVRLVEMKPHKMTPAHHTDRFAELVCSNSLRSDSLSNAVGLLKEELRRCGSLIMEAADATRVPAGSALAVDREKFSAYITERIRSCPQADSIPDRTTVRENIKKRALCSLQFHFVHIDIEASPFSVPDFQHKNAVYH